MTSIGNNTQSTSYYDYQDESDAESPKTGAKSGGETDGGYTYEDLINMGFSEERAQRFIDEHSSQPASTTEEETETTEETDSTNNNQRTSNTEEETEAESEYNGYSVDELVEMGVDPDVAEKIVSNSGDTIEDQDVDEDESETIESELDDSDKLTAADLEDMGLDESVAAYVTDMFGHTYGTDEAKITGKELNSIIEDGDLNLSASGKLSVPLKTSDGYNIYELLQESELTPEEAEFLIYEASEDQVLTKEDFKKYVDEDGTLSDAGQRLLGDKEFEGNPISIQDAISGIEEDAEFTQEQLEELGLSQEVSEYLTQDGPLSGSELISLIENRALQAGKVDDSVEFRPIGSTTEVPPDGLAMPALIDSGLPVDEAQWLMDTYGQKGLISEEDVEKYIDTPKAGGAELSEEAREQYELKDKDADTLLEDGATYEELIALGFSSADTSYLIAYHGDTKTKSVDKETIEELQEKGFIVDDPDQTDPQRLMLQGEKGISADEANEQAADFAGGADEDSAIVTIAQDGTGNFFSAGSDKFGPASNVNIQQSVIYSRDKNEDGKPVGDYNPTNGDDQGLFDKDALKSLGFNQDQVDAIFEHAKSADTNDEVPGKITMSELKNAIIDDVEGIGAISEVVGQAVVMRQNGEPRFEEQDNMDSPFAPTQQEAQWLNENYGGGDGLTESELANALEDGVVQIIDGSLQMTAHGKSMAFADKGPTDGDIDSYQETLVRRAYLEFDPNGVGNERSIDLDTMMDMYNGNLSEADAKLILECYGDGETLTQGQLTDAIKENHVIISEKSGDAEGSDYTLKITPKGYEDMAEKILDNPDSPYMKQIEGILNYPEDKGLETINVDQLQENHGLSKEDAYALVAQYDTDGDGALRPKELLSAILANSITLSDQNQITEVHLDPNNTEVGPYTVDELADKIECEEPAAEDIASAMFLAYGIDPANENKQLTDQQVEDYLRDHPYLTQDNEGVMRLVEGGEKPKTDDVWNALTSDDDQTDIKMPHNDDREASKDTRYKDSDWKKNSTLSRGETYVLSNYLHKEGYGNLGDADNRTDVKSSDLHLTRKDIEKMVEEGILTLNSDGKVDLTAKGDAIIAANSAADTIAFFDYAEESGETYKDEDGNRVITKDAWTDDKKFQEGKWEWRSRDLQIENGFDPGDGGATIGGLHWAINEGYDHISYDPAKDEPGPQHESIKMD